MGPQTVTGGHWWHVSGHLASQRNAIYEDVCLIVKARRGGVDSQRRDREGQGSSICRTVGCKSSCPVFDSI